MSKIEPSVTLEEMPNPSPAELLLPEFEALWQVVKNWDINVRTHYRLYCSGNGSHVKMLLDGLNLYRGEFLSRANLTIRVMHEGGDERPLITAVNGECTIESLSDIEEQLREHEFGDGPGDYVFEAFFMDAQKDDYGRTELSAFWELTQVRFQIFEHMKPVDPNSPKKPCPTCGLVDCGGKDFFDQCIPF